MICNLAKKCSAVDCGSKVSFDEERMLIVNPLRSDKQGYAGKVPRRRLCEEVWQYIGAGSVLQCGQGKQEPWRQETRVETALRQWIAISRSSRAPGLQGLRLEVPELQGPLGLR